MKTLKPSEIVTELDKYIIGQHQAKRSVAVALRNRWRRQQVPVELRNEIAPKNIILIGPTGVGKTEIARRLSMLTESPFHKVEASKFTEVGYVGRDVESMVRELIEMTITIDKARAHEAVKEKARLMAEERMLDLLSDVLRNPTTAIHTAASGAELVVMLTEQGPFDLIVTDIDMPWMDGMAATQSARGSEVQAPVLVISGISRPGLADEVNRLGNARLLRKPIEVCALRQAVSELLGDSSSRRG